MSVGTGLGGRVAIIGSGVIKYGENFHQSLTDMIYEAVTVSAVAVLAQP